jgi:hypothetical protein
MRCGTVWRIAESGVPTHSRADWFNLVDRDLLGFGFPLTLKLFFRLLLQIALRLLMQSESIANPTARTSKINLLGN